MTYHESRSESAGADRIIPRLVVLSAAFLLGTIAIFFLYRLAFFHLFAPSSGNWPSICLAGVRLDVALVAAEFLVLALVFLMFRYLRLRAFAMALLVLSLLHAALAVLNLLFFSERHQHLWEMLIANISRPAEIYVAVAPWVETRSIHVLLALAAAAAIVVLAARGGRRVPPLRLDLWSPRRRLHGATALCVALIALTLDPVAYQTTRFWRFGWIPLPTASQLYMRYDTYQENQAVVNPVHDLVRFYVPSILAGLDTASAARVEPAEALATSRTLLGVQATRGDFPLLQRLPPGPQLGIKNVVLIILEGFSGSILHRKEGGVEITPYLNELSRRGLSFSNIIQSYNATDGSVFSTLTGLHKTFVNQHWQYFLPTEVNSYFGSLAYLLGKEEYRHFAMFGFQNRREDFTAFLRNQGFETFDLASLTEASASEGRASQAMRNSLGLFDHVLFDETERILRRRAGPYTTVLITATTHSPWVVPKAPPTGPSHAFADARLNTFRYVDDSVRDFVAALNKSRPNGLDDTLLVITGDHTSLTFTGGQLERLRVPLIFFSPRLEPAAAGLNPEPDIRGSHVDILPTVLQLLDGQHAYSGMGVSLISANRANARVISSSRFLSLYFDGDFVLQYAPSSPGTAETQLFAIRDGEIVNSDISASHPDVKARLQRDFFSIYETSARLIKEKRVIPPPGGIRLLPGAS